MGEKLSEWAMGMFWMIGFSGGIIVSASMLIVGQGLLNGCIYEYGKFGVRSLATVLARSIHV